MTFLDPEAPGVWESPLLSSPFPGTRQIESEWGTPEVVLLECVRSDVVGVGGGRRGPDPFTRFVLPCERGEGAGETGSSIWKTREYRGYSFDS